MPAPLRRQLRAAWSLAVESATLTLTELDRYARQFSAIPPTAGQL